MGPQGLFLFRLLDILVLGYSVIGLHHPNLSGAFGVSAIGATKDSQFLVLLQQSADKGKYFVTRHIILCTLDPHNVAIELGTVVVKKTPDLLIWLILGFI